MSVFFPYSPSVIVDYLSSNYSLTFSTLSDFEKTIILIFSNLYFFITWSIIIYFALKLFNRIWERIF